MYVYINKNTNIMKHTQGEWNNEVTSCYKILRRLAEIEKELIEASRDLLKALDIILKGIQNIY